MQQPFGIYIHIPFCIRKCRYCDFLSAPADGATRHAYVSALCGEIREAGEEWRMRNYGNPCTVDTVFLGGGTPTILDPEELSAIMDCLRENFMILSDAEITMEMNPGTYSENMLEFVKRYLNRVSIGLQSVRNDELRMLGRIHSYEEFEMCYRALRGAGMSNINVDLMSAIPGQTTRRWEETLCRVVSLEPEHISAYSLIVEEGTPFYDLYEKGELELPDEDSEREMYHLTEKILKESGYQRYEISNYARSGRACRHNVRYWKREPYLGFGIGAASLYGQLNSMKEIRTSGGKPDASVPFDVFSGQYRRTNREDLTGYIDRYGNGDSKVCEDGAEIVALTFREAVEEYMFLGLRMTKGISIKDFYDRFGFKIDDLYGDVLCDFSTKGLLERQGDRIALTERGLDIGNTVMSGFLFD